MGRIRTWLHGYVEIYVSGNRPERFLSLLNHKNLFVWDMEPAENGYLFKIDRRSVKELDPLRKKTGSKLEIRNKYGLPFLLFRYRKRKLFLGGLILCGGLVYLCSLFLYGGTDRRPDRRILCDAGNAEIKD